MKRLLSILSVLTLLMGLMPLAALPVYAGHVCPNCDEWIDGSPYCEYCYECAECCELCLECGICADCSGWEICGENCGDDGPICVDCAIDKGYHCPDCYECYLKELLWCDSCGLCKNCTDICDACSVYMGEGTLCVDCAEESHCPGCGECYFGVLWCDECKLCENCSEYCGPCTSEVGVNICQACAIDAGLHCPDCTNCYDESNWEYCSECGICANCVEYCDAYDLCLYCAIDNGYHCPACGGCCEDEPICVGCGDACRECADDFCESCGMCSNCVQVCPSCGACSECAEICPNCGEYCSDCEDICDDCEYCLVCCADIAAFEGCDCADPVCVENDDWQEHFDQEHAETFTDGHTARPVKSWSWDENRHWQVCLHCDDAEHYSNRFAHTYDKRGMCTVCNYAKNSNIQILKQPQDVKNVKVRSPYEDCDGSNLAHFSVQAVGKSELTYTWYERRYIGVNEWEYVPLKNPEMGEKFTGPDLYIYAGTDACYTTRYYMCIITDEEGNQARTVEVALQGQHNYQYFKYYQGDYPSDPYETAATAPNYHNLQCVGEGCEKTVCVRPHEDENEDDACDICRRDMPKILITQQPKDARGVLVTSPDEEPLPGNYATFTVKAEGKSELTYTWYRYENITVGQWGYVPLTEPSYDECFDGPTLRVLAATDACTGGSQSFYCIITDEDGNEAKTITVRLEGKHNYQYYEHYHSQTDKYEEAKRKEVGHVAVCVGEECGKVSRLSAHIDADKDFQCDICRYISYIDELRLNYTQPAVGRNPDYNMTVDISACYIRGNGIDRTYRRWYESDNGVDGWRLMSATDTFKAGKYYNVEVDVATISGREFSTYNYPATTHTVWLWTYDKRGKLLQTGSLSHKNYATLTMETPYYCQPQEISEIAVSGVDQPIAGQKPDYEIGLDTDGYKQDTGSTQYSKKGVAWKRVNDTEAMHVDGTFIAGYAYQCRITLIAEENRVFAPGAVATVNGQPATVELYDNNRMAVVSYEYQVPTARVREIHLTGVQNPWEETEVDWYAETNSDLFCVDEFSWHDLTLDEAHSGAFVPGHQYEIGFYLVTQTVDSNFQCEFDENTVVTVNGRPATVLSVNWDGWTGSSIYFTYLCPPTGEKVRLVTAPTSVDVDEGETASVSLTATGDDLTYAWYYKNKGEAEFSKTDSFTGPTYSVEMNESRDGRQVYCVVTDGNGNYVVTDTVTLSMAASGLAITTQPKTTYAKEGATAKVTVKASGDGLKYTWYIKNAGKTKYSKSSVTSATYSVKISDASHGRYVYCVVTDEHGDSVKTKTVVIRRQASITKEPSVAAYAQLGAKVSVKITAKGDGLKYAWYIKNESKSTYSKSSVTSATYSATMSSKVKGRKVYCVVTDKYGKTVQSKTFVLREAVSIVTQPKTVTVKKNATAKVTVKASGDGLKYTWYVKNAGASKYSKSSVTKSTYSVTMTSKVKDRLVYCVVTDKYGKTVKTATVKLKMK